MLVVKACTEDITTMLKFIIASGVSVEAMSTKRQYGSSGEKHVWKFGSSFYNVSKHDDGTTTLKSIRLRW